MTAEGALMADAAAEETPRAAVEVRGHTCPDCGRALPCPLIGMDDLSRAGMSAALLRHAADLKEAERRQAENQAETDAVGAENRRLREEVQRLNGQIAAMTRPVPVRQPLPQGPPPRPQPPDGRRVVSVRPDDRPDWTEATPSGSGDGRPPARRLGGRRPR